MELELPKTDNDCHAYFEAHHTLYGTSENSSRYESYAWIEAVHQIGRLSEHSLRQLEKYRFPIEMTMVANTDAIRILQKSMTGIGQIHTVEFYTVTSENQ